jgi:hypothetical protein
MKQTTTDSLEKAYLKLTGKSTRDENAGSQNSWAQNQRAKAMR